MSCTLARSVPAAARCASAACRCQGRSGPPRASEPACTYRYAVRAPTASAASCRPSRTRCGANQSSAASLLLAGSPSAPLATTTGLPPALATADSFLATGNAAPPRPVRPAAPTSLDQRSAADPLPGRAGASARPGRGRARGRRRRPVRGPRPGAAAAGRARPAPPGGRFRSLWSRVDGRRHRAPAPVSGRPPAALASPARRWPGSCARRFRAGQRASRPLGPAGRDRRAGDPPAGSADHRRRAQDGERKETAAEQVAARPDAVQERHRPAGVGEPVDRAPAAAADPGPGQAGDNQRDDDVQRHCAEADPERPCRRR